MISTYRLLLPAPLLLTLILSPGLSLTPKAVAGGSALARDRGPGESLHSVLWDGYAKDGYANFPVKSNGLVDLNGVEPLESEFNKDRGTIRILLLMSPT
ncbi:MAG TPA: hypothetical protein VEZ90_15005 [Blastocatellia bacterium]|nr:hypothetical protein [Blastocatellia bacterium]